MREFFPHCEKYFTYKYFSIFSITQKKKKEGRYEKETIVEEEEIASFKFFDIFYLSLSLSLYTKKSNLLSFCKVFVVTVVVVVVVWMSNVSSVDYRKKERGGVVVVV